MLKGDVNIDELILLMTLPGFIIGLSLHEYSHALVADKLGDPTPREQGRLTIEPWSHIDILGTLAFFLLGIGWAKPVQVDTRNFKKPRRDDILVSIAGPITNLIVAILFAAAAALVFRFAENIDDIAVKRLLQILDCSVRINVLLAVFNMLPIPPLDGSSIIANILPVKQAAVYMFIQRHFIFILLILFLFGGAIINPATDIIYSLIIHAFGIFNNLQSLY